MDIVSSSATDSYRYENGTKLNGGFDCTPDSLPYLELKITLIEIRYLIIPYLLF